MAEHANEPNREAEHGSFTRDGEADLDRRTWYKQGSVADDRLQQLQEAEQDGSLFGQLVNYAARSALDKEHRTFEGAKLAGKAVAAPAKGAATTAKAAGKTAQAAGKAIGTTARAADKAVRTTGRAAGKAAQAPIRGGKAILDAARRHRSGQREHGTAKSAAREQAKSRASRAKSQTKTRDREPGR